VDREYQRQPMMRKYLKSVCHISCTRVVGCWKRSDALISTYAGLVMRSAAFRIRYTLDSDTK
jgi:hypothetical protein